MYAEANFQIPLFNFGLCKDPTSSIERTAQRVVMVVYGRMEMFGER
jgi:hypothetical protein